MSEEKRRFSRIAGELFVSLIIKEKKTGQVIVGPVSGVLRNISSFGAGVSTDIIQVGNTHLFYASIEDVDLTLCLEVGVPGNEGGKFTLRVRPVWFDRVLADLKTPFHMGLEFDEALDKEQLAQLKTIVVEMPEDKHKTWEVFIQKLYSFFSKLKDSV